MPRPFTTIKQSCKYIYEEKRSEFIAYLYPIKDKTEGQSIYEKLKIQYPDARHHCSAYIIGDPEQAKAAGFNDDGEPSGTAGKPMLNVLMQRKIGNVYAVVVRYFGGIKLGAGGLTRAYGQAVSGAVDLAELITLEPSTQANILCNFDMEEKMRKLLNDLEVYAIEAQYSQQVTLCFECDDKHLPELKDRVVNVSSGQANLITEFSNHQD